MELYTHLLRRAGTGAAGTAEAAGAAETASALVNSASSEDVVTALFHSWMRDAEENSSSLYQFPVEIADTSCSFFELFEKYFMAVERYLAAGNRSALYGRLGNLLVQYYLLYDSLSTRRYAALQVIAGRAQDTTGNLRGPNDDVVIDLSCSQDSNISNGASQLPVTDAKDMQTAIMATRESAAVTGVTRRTDITIPRPVLISLSPPAAAAGNGNGNGNGEDVDVDVGAGGSRGTAVCTEGLGLDTLRNEDTADEHKTNTGVSKSYAVVDSCEVISVDDQDSTTRGEDKGKENNATFSSSSTNSSSTNSSNTSSTNSSNTSSSNSSAISIESVVAWCRRQSAWHKEKTAGPTSIRAAIAASLRTPAVPPPTAPSNTHAQEQLLQKSIKEVQKPAPAMLQTTGVEPSLSLLPSPLLAPGVGSDGSLAGAPRADASISASGTNKNNKRQRATMAVSDWLKDM